MRFLRELEAAVPEFQIMMKVRAAALLRPVGGSEQEKAFARGVRARAVSRGDPWISAPV